MSVWMYVRVWATAQCSVAQWCILYIFRYGKTLVRVIWISCKGHLTFALVARYQVRYGKLGSLSVENLWGAATRATHHTIIIKNTMLPTVGRGANLQSVVVGFTATYTFSSISYYHRVVPCIAHYTKQTTLGSVSNDQRGCSDKSIKPATKRGYRMGCIKCVNFTAIFLNVKNHQSHHQFSGQILRYNHIL